MTVKGVSSQRKNAPTDVPIIAPQKKRLKIAIKNLEVKIVFVPLQPQERNGTLADRLGNGLQNRLEQFDSARYLHTGREF